MRLMFVSLFIFFVNPAFAKSPPAKTLANFVPGEYRLVEGKNEQCSGGNFKIRKDGVWLELGVLHAFRISPFFSRIESDVSYRRGCIYYTHEDARPYANKTLLSFNSDLICNQDRRNNLTQKVVVTPDKITLNYKQEPDPAFKDVEVSINYRCAWERVNPKANTAAKTSVTGGGRSPASVSPVNK